jgi:tryptophan 7-halogenase
MSDTRIRRIVIVGGGTAGWMTAATLSRFLKNNYCRIQLIESDEIGIVGVGESTIPQMRIFNRMLALDEDEFVRKTQATFKLAIEFRDWTHIGHIYHHPFGPYGFNIEGVSFHSYLLKLQAMGEAPDIGVYNLQTVGSRMSKFMRPVDKPGSPLSQIAYAFHFDAYLYARYLRGFAEEHGVVRTEGKIMQVSQNGESGFIESVTLASGERVEGDLFIDCSGFRGLLIEQTLKTGFEDWSHWLLNDRAWAVQCASGGETTPVTRATARPHGWQWRIPLQHRIGNGYAFCSEFVSEDEARATLLANLDGEPLREPWMLKFKAGRRLKSWHRNVVAIGLSAGFMEPLESQSIFLIQVGISRLLGMFPDRNFDQVNIDRYNRLMSFEYEKIRDFLVLHYNATTRNDTPYWDYLRNMKVPDYLDDKVRLFQATGRIFRENEELFNDTSWFAVMVGQGLKARAYDPVVDVMPDDELRQRLGNVKKVVASSAASMPDHMEFIARHCAAPPV